MTCIDQAYLEQIPNVPFLANHIVMCFTAANFCRLAVHENLLDNEAHSAEAVCITILPDRIVVDFMDAINETYLEVNCTMRKLIFQNQAQLTR